MVRANILIQLKSGRVISYANKYIRAKKGSDAFEVVSILDVQTLEPIFDKKLGYLRQKTNTQKFKGKNCCYYCYTGKGNDTYEKQSQPGFVKYDYEFLLNQLDVVGKEFLEFPEKNEGYYVSYEGVDELVREKGDGSIIREKIRISQIESITVNEAIIDHPFYDENARVDKESIYYLPGNELESRKLRNYDRGPDFGKNWKTCEDIIEQNRKKREKKESVLKFDLYSAQELVKIFESHRDDPVKDYNHDGYEDGGDEAIIYLGVKNIDDFGYVLADLYTLIDDYQVILYGWSEATAQELENADWEITPDTAAIIDLTTFELIEYISPADYW